jgi:hypothetical protein
MKIVGIFMPKLTELLKQEGVSPPLYPTPN